MKLGKKKIICFSVIIAIIAVVGAVGFAASGVFTDKKVPGTYLAAGTMAEQIQERFSTGTYGYEYGEAIEGLKRNDTIEVPMGLEPQEFPAERWSELIQLYEDPELKHPSYATYTYDKERKVVILTPPTYSSAAIRATSVSIETVRKYTHDDVVFFPQNVGEDWGNLSTLYMAVYYDLETGEKLDEPIVHIVSKEGEIEEAPTVDYSVTEDGRVSLTWNAVEGADEYFVCSIQYSEEGGFGTSMANVLGVTQDTVFVPKSPNFGDLFANGYEFKCFDVSQDDWADYYDKEALIEEYGPDPVPVSYRDYDVKTALCVFAINTEGNSMMSNAVKLDSIVSMLPYSKAMNAWQENGYSYAEYTDYAQLPAYGYVTMCDGYTAQKLLHYDTEKAKVFVQNYILMEDGEAVGDEDVVVLKIPYVIDGTPFEDYFVVQYFQEEDFEEALNFLSEREAKLRKKSGEVPLNNNLDVESKEIEEPSVRQIEEVKITANSAMSEYLARCMMSNAETIDLSEFNEAADKRLVEDTLLEAYYQNPLILGISGYKIDSRKRVIYMAYENDAEEATKKQKEILQKVSEICDEIITDDMTDLEKELAINEYLCATIVYDEDALDNAMENDFAYVDEAFNDSFNAYGALINGKCVCAGYAAAFKLLAEEAGLDTVVVTGFLDGSYGHAWNKVNIDGAWQIIDVTNNDTEYLTNALFNLPDRAGDITLIEDEDYMLDNFISDYDSVNGDKEFYRINDKYFDYSEIADKLLAELKKNGSATLRTEYDLDDDAFNKIAKQVAQKLPRDEELYGFYWMGVIYLEVK